MPHIAAILFALFIATVLAGPASPPDATVRIAGVLRDDAHRGFTGVALVALGNHIIFNRAYGAERGVEMRPDSRFWIASGGKQFTSAAILKCAEKGRLHLDDRISRFFPDAPVDKRAITILQLLSHTSGFGQSYVSEGQTKRAVAVRRMLAEPLVDTPGHKFNYSNTNYQLAVAILEIASGKNYRSFVTTELFEPAGLRDTGFAGTPGAKAVVPAKGVTPERLSTPSWGGEGVYSTALDLLTWYNALRSGIILSRASVHMLFRPVAHIREGEAGLGWFIGKTGTGAKYYFTRGNEDFGANSLLYAYPSSDTVIVVLTHAGYSNVTTSWSRKAHAEIQSILGL